jgi:FkbM family methyltransferase
MSESADDKPFRHRSRKDRAVSWISQTFFDGLTYTVRHGPLKGMRRRGGLGWLPEQLAGGKESAEHLFLQRLDLAGKVVFDVGAFHGLLTLFFARRARQVVCYEPNPANHQRLIENLRLNHIDNVTVRNLGLGAVSCSAEMVWSPAMPGAATVAATSMSKSIRSQATAEHGDIRITTLDMELSETALPSPDFIKIDVEGYELPVLEGARQLLEARHPKLYLEIHGETMNDKRRNAKAVIEHLDACGYASILHVESGQLVSPNHSEAAAQGHLYVEP